MKKYNDFSDEEINLLNNEEMSLLAYLKGFNRDTLKKWSEKGLLDYSLDY